MPATNASFWAEISSGKKFAKFGVKAKNKGRWFLITNRNDVDIADSGSKRNMIETLFQCRKSSAFDTDKTKIKKYDRMKRLLDLSAICYTLMVVLTHFIKLIKKLSNHWDIVLTFLNSEWPSYYNVLDQSTEIFSSIWFSEGVRTSIPSTTTGPGSSINFPIFGAILPILTLGFLLF
jgi:hypothetical protein